MSLLIDDLKEEREEVLAEIDLRERALEGLHEELSEWRQTLADFDRAIAALEPAPTDEQPELFEDEKAVAREQLEREDDASEFAEPMPDPEFIELDEQTCEPVEEAPALNEAMQDEREQPVEGYAPVTNPEADFWARGIEQPKPEPFRLASIFRREKEEA